MHVLLANSSTIEISIHSFLFSLEAVVLAVIRDNARPKLPDLNPLVTFA